MNKPWLKGSVSLAALAGLFWLLSRIGWDEVGLRLGQVGVAGFALLCLTGLAEAALDGAALRKAASGCLPFLAALFINQAGAAVNILVPGEAGEVFKASLLARHLPSREATSAVVVWNMAFRLSKSLVILLASCAAFAFLPADRYAAAWALGLAAFNLSLYFALNAVLKRRWIGRALSVLKRPYVARLIDHIRDAEGKAAAFSGRRPGDYASIAAFQACARVAGFATLWLALRFLGYGYAFPLCLLIYTLTELATYAVALLPTKIGTTEGSTYLIFEFLGLQGPLGAILQIVLRIKQLAIVSLFLIAGILTRGTRGETRVAPVDYNATT
ncbi:MAG TPA: lysylphosphatidylglycerol synthase domain-containing protein [bacterium]|nr:lysylphosphatidylglycerol synthase domain-containing protein [bacterium]